MLMTIPFEKYTRHKITMKKEWSFRASLAISHRESEWHMPFVSWFEFIQTKKTSIVYYFSCKIEKTRQPYSK